MSSLGTKHVCHLPSRMSAKAAFHLGDRTTKKLIRLIALRTCSLHYQITAVSKGQASMRVSLPRRKSEQSRLCLGK